MRKYSGLLTATVSSYVDLITLLRNIKFVFTDFDNDTDDSPVEKFCSKFDLTSLDVGIDKEIKELNDGEKNYVFNARFDFDLDYEWEKSGLGFCFSFGGNLGKLYQNNKVVAEIVDYLDSDVFETVE